MAKKKTERDPLLLMQWANDGFPPIDMHRNAKHVIDLINEVKKLRKQVESLQEKPQKEPSFGLIKEIWTREYPLLSFNGASAASINFIIKETRRIMKEGGKDFSEDAIVYGFQFVVDYVKKTKHWINGSPLTTWRQQYTSVIQEIADGGKKKPLTTREKINQL